jgi:uncharacterized protein (DUF362 family)
MFDPHQSFSFLASRVAAMHGPDSYADPAAVRTLVADALTALELPEDFIREGDKVVLKPNWVKECDERFHDDQHWDYVITHPAVIEGVIEWVAPKLAGRGHIVACDAPQTDSSFAKLAQYSGLSSMISRQQANWPSLKIELLDLRPEEWTAVDGVTVASTQLPGDPLGSTEVKLNAASEFVGFHGLGKLYGASYDMAETNRHHEGETHEYMLSRTPMDADVLINIPKLKTHKKVGATIALKNLVGINANKNWLPHHTEGTPESGGDQFPKATAKAKLEHSLMGRAKRLLKGNHLLSRLFIPMKKLGRLVFGDTQKVVRSGNWHGNDTCWRMCADLNKCLFHFDGAGQPRRAPLRYLAVVDGIVGGDGKGPMAPDPKPCGVIVAGANPLAVDCVGAALMGFDFRKLALLRQPYQFTHLPFALFKPEDVTVVSNKPEWTKRMVDFRKTDGFSFRPHFGWTGAVEMDS